MKVLPVILGLVLKNLEKSRLGGGLKVFGSSSGGDEHHHTERLKEYKGQIQKKWNYILEGRPFVL